MQKSVGTKIAPSWERSVESPETKWETKEELLGTQTKKFPYSDFLCYSKI